MRLDIEKRLERLEGRRGAVDVLGLVRAEIAAQAGEIPADPERTRRLARALPVWVVRKLDLEPS